MTTQPRDLARRWFEEVWNDRRSETVHEIMGEGALGHMEGADIVGPDRFLDARAALLEAFPDIRVRVEDVVSDGDRAVVRWSASAHHTGALLGIPPSGRAVRFRGMSWMVFRNGKLVEGWDSWNLGALLNDCRAASG